MRSGTQEGAMKTNTTITQEIINILKEAEIGVPVCENRPMEELRQENERLKKLVARQARDIKLLKELSMANW
jgi:hypothetical protein